MKTQTVEQATGRGKAEWFEIIRSAGKAKASHKEIADFLKETHDISYWWAQEITVEYEQHIGRRVLGQTQDGFYQIGVSRTVPVPANSVWELLHSTEGIDLITRDPAVDPPPGHGADVPSSMMAMNALNGQSATGVRVTTTTFESGSHVRMRWQRRGWPTHSILQIRVLPKSETKTTLSFHQERLPSRDARNDMQSHWRRTAQLMAEMLAPAGSKGE